MRYVTFGQSHRHIINGKVFDHHCIAVVDGDREKVFEIFGRKWCFEYSEDEFDDFVEMSYYPRGLILVG